MRGIRLIINADDLGISLSVNKAIERAIQERSITSSTILANGPAYEDAIRIAKSYPQISFGIHLNVDEFKPLTDDYVFRKYNLIDESGCFKKEVLRDFDSIEDDLIDAIYREWKAQINRIMASGIHPTHIDSHEHTHGIYQLRVILERLLIEFKIKRVRRQPYYSLMEMIIVKRIQQQLQDNKVVDRTGHKKKRHSFIYRRFAQIGLYIKHKRWLRFMRSNNIVMTGYFDSYQVFCHSYPWLRKWVKFDTIELMVHPGHVSYQEETNLLMQKQLKNICNYQLINYNSI